MKRILVFYAIFLTIALHASSVEPLSLRDITSGNFYGESMAAAHPLPGGEHYACISSDGKQIVKYSFRNGQADGVLFDAATAHGARIRRVEGYILSPDGKRILIQTATQRIYRHSFTATYYIYSIANNKLEPLSDNGPQQTPVWSPDGLQVAFVRQNNIYLVKLLYNNAESQVTTDGAPNSIINGIPDWVNEEEFSLSSAMTFSADSKQIVWVRYDESQVQQVSLPMYGPEPGGQSTSGGWYYTYKYPKAGSQNASVSLRSYDIKSHQTRTMQLPLDADGYIARLKPTSDPARVAVFTLNRHQDCLRIYMANPLTTICQLVIEDKVDKYVSDNVLDQTIITQGHIVMTSERDGFNRIYVYTLNGQLLRSVADVPVSGIQLLPAATPHTVVTAVYGYNESNGDVFFAAHPGSPLDQKVYVAHQNGRIDCLTQKDGWNSALFSTDFRSFIHTWSDLNTPPQVSLCTVNGSSSRKTATIIDNAELASRYVASATGQKEFFTFTTSEGVSLCGWMVKPAHFDPSRRYPVVMYQYGGPGNQQVFNAWGVGMMRQGAILEQLLAQKGYIAVCVDNRGTGGRGAEFEKCTYLQLGLLEARDQVEAALWLGQQPYVDKDRIAIWGWSYGGWNTLMAMSEGRPAFCCGIAIAPPTSWRFYDTVYAERFMRTPQENAANYDGICPLARAGSLNGSLLLCHGLADDNVHYQNTALYVEALVQADKDFQQLVYTDKNHSIYGGNTRNHLFRQCLNFFDRCMAVH